MSIDDVRKLVRAYDLLAASCDDLRVIAGRVSREWIASESECSVCIAGLPRAALATVRGQDILAEELFKNQNIDPANIDPRKIDLDRDADKLLINSNRLSKLEPVINAAVLVGNLLLGVQRYGRKGRGFPEIDNDLIAAAIVRGALGRKHPHSALLPEHYAVVDEKMIEQRLGAGVLKKLLDIERYRKAFQLATNDGAASRLVMPKTYANVVAAIAASDLRLVARAAGDEIFCTLEPAQKRELQAAGIELDGEFPERLYLDRAYRETRAALALPGVDHAALFEPLNSTLMVSVGDALADSGKRRRLVGRRGKAIHDVHNNLPMMEYYNAGEHPNSLSTVHVAGLELMRHLDKCRRKAFNTMLAHAFHIAGVIEQAFGSALEPRVASMALLHDIVEDGSPSVAGYDQSLHKLKLRFGGPLAAMVSELTDSPSQLDGSRKAQTTLHSDRIVAPELQYNFDRFSSMKLQPTDADTPYTLQGMVVKLADTAATFEEGVRDPDMMSGWWRHSGIRIYWAQNVRGGIVLPLIERLVLEIHASQRDSRYSARSGALPVETLAGLKRLLATVLNWSDRYMVVNLAILAREYGLDRIEHDRLYKLFTDPMVSIVDFETEILEMMLRDDRLQASIDLGLVPARPYVTLFKHSDASPTPKDCSTFLRYRESALRRAAIRDELGLSSPDESDHKAVLSLYRLRAGDATSDVTSS